jgi:uncharacterized membrane protein YhaH (DUF805 family)
MFGDDYSPPTTTVSVLGYVGVLWISGALAAKRLHDLDKSGWYALVLLVPVLGYLATIIYCGFQPGNGEDNRFGRGRQAPSLSIFD